MPFFYVDWYYIVLVLPAVILSLWASAHVKSTFRRYSQVRNARGMTGAEAAMAVLRAHGVTDVRVEHVSGDLTDHFDPKDHVIRLSDSVYNVATPAAVGVAAHEAGHAIQDAQDYAPLRIRSTMVPIANIGSGASIPLFMLGLILSWEPLVKIGIFCFALAVLFYVVTLPVEFNASGRAVKVLAAGYLPEDEVRGVKAVLSAAALTYVAAALQAVLQLLRLILISGNSRRRD